MSDATTVLKGLTAQNVYDLRGIVAVVTGGGTGIGLMISTTLMANGATVYIVGPKQEELDHTAKIYNEAALSNQQHGKLVGIEADIRLKSEAKRLADELEQREGHVTVIFNNAGILTGSFTPPKEATAAAYVEAHWAVTPDDFDNVYRTNAVGAYWLSIAFLPLLEKWKATEGGKKFPPQIVMTSSMNGWTKDLDTSGRSYPYHFSKAAIGAFTSSLAHELLPLDIRVNGIAPGLFVTPMSFPTANVNPLGQVATDAINVSFKIPTVATGGSNRDVGSLALFLISNWFVNGETVLIDGGTLLVHPSSY